MQVICIEDAAFYELLNRIIEHVKQTHSLAEKQWISGEDAMTILHIKSKTTLQKLRDEGDIRYTQPERRIILYDRESLYDYLKLHAKEPFGTNIKRHAK